MSIKKQSTESQSEWLPKHLVIEARSIFLYFFIVVTLKGNNRVFKALKSLFMELPTYRNNIVTTCSEIYTN
jgi:hypothetical protein